MRALVLAAGLLAIGPAAAEPELPNHDGVELIFGDAAKPRIAELFLEYHPDYYEDRAARDERFDELGRVLFDRTVAGADLTCSRQIFVEAKWLLGYTAWWWRLDRRLDELEGSFVMQDQSFAAEPYYKDGNYGRCAEEPFVRLEDTLERYFVLADRGELPSMPRTPLQGVRDAIQLHRHFERLLVSDIPLRGEDYRSRLGGLASIVAATFRREHATELLRKTIEGEPLSEAAVANMRATFNRFVDAWQDPETGYWGAWYEDDGEVFKTTDLSITYHIVHARKGRVRHWPELIATTLEISDHAYPFGWLSAGHWHNHNNYDVARLFNYGWEHMTPNQQAEVAAIMQEMVDWSFAETVMEDYEGFKFFPELSSSVNAEFYFGVSFLDAAAFFEDQPWFGQLERPADPRPVCAALESYVQTLEEEPYALGAERKLDRMCEPWREASAPSGTPG